MNYNCGSSTFEPKSTQIKGKISRKFIHNFIELQFNPHKFLYLKKLCLPAGTIHFFRLVIALGNENFLAGKLFPQICQITEFERIVPNEHKRSV